MNKIFIDCGSHKGQSIIKARKDYGSDIKIIAFEAVPYLAYSLQEYYKEDSNVEVNWNAVWISNEPVKLNLPRKGASWSNSLYSRWKEEDTLQHLVPSIDLSTWIKSNFNKDDYIILKLDIEGAEYEVLNKMIDDGTVDYINEFHGEWHDNKISNIPTEAVLRVKEYFNDKKFHIWEAPWYDESTPGMTKFPLYLNPSDGSQPIWGMVNPFQKITFVIPSRNNLEFLQLAYKSIRNLDTVHQILVLDDASTDGTWNWLKDTMSIDPELTCFRNDPKNGRIGIVGMFDKGIEMATTDIIMAFHADMVACRDLDKNILKHLIPGTVVSATRVEPPLHPEGPEKIIRNLGIEVDEFDFNSWYEVSEELKEDRQTEGIFAPWCMYKEDFLAIGGHDELFAPQSKEDSDLFNRFVLNGYKIIQPWDALVYHFTSRGSRFNKHSGGAAGKNSEEWQYTTTKNMRNFIRKWGHFVMHDKFMKPIIPPKFNIGVVIPVDGKLIELLEPWFDNVYVDAIDTRTVHEYIVKEQPNTKINLSERIKKNIPEHVNNDIIVSLNSTFTNEDFNYIQQLSQILDLHKELGTFELGNLKIEVHSLEEYQDSLIFI